MESHRATRSNEVADRRTGASAIAERTRDDVERPAASVDLPQPRRLTGQGSRRPTLGRARGEGFGAALPSGRRSWQDNGHLYAFAAESSREAHGPFALATAFETPPKITDAVLTFVSRILAVAENGDPRGDPAGVYVYPDGNGGRRQVTLGIGFTEDSGSLRTVIQNYVDGGGRFADQMRPFLPRIGGNPNLSGNAGFKALLKRAGREDGFFAEIQQQVFQDDYLQPAARFCMRERLTEPLSFLVVADSYLHSGGILAFLRARFPERTPANGGNEARWVKQYVDVRHDWLRTHSRPILRNTIYRTRAMKEQIAAQNWALVPPVRMNGTIVGMPA